MAWSVSIKLSAAKKIFKGVTFEKIQLEAGVPAYKATIPGRDPVINVGLTNLCIALWIQTLKDAGFDVNVQGDDYTIKPALTQSEPRKSSTSGS